MFRQKLTISGHEMAGNLLREAYLCALHAETAFSNALGRHARVTKAARRAVVSSLLARSAADDLFFVENPDAERSPYFGDHQFIPEAAGCFLKTK